MKKASSVSINVMDHLCSVISDMLKGKGMVKLLSYDVPGLLIELSIFHESIIKYNSIDF